MAWLYLALAGLFEIGWPSLQLSQRRPEGLGIAGAIVSMGSAAAVAGTARDPIGTAYAVWTGIGGPAPFDRRDVFGDALTLGRTLGVALIVGGVVTLKLAH